MTQSSFIFKKNTIRYLKTSSFITMESKKAIIVCQLNNRITVETAWDGGLVNFFRTIEKRFWCSQNKVWSFPLPTKEKITEELTRRGYTIDCSESKPVVNITENGGNTFEVEADYHPAICTVINEMPGAKWDRVSRMHRIPSEHLTVFVETLNRKNMHYTLTSKSMEGFDTVDTTPVKPKVEPTCHTPVKRMPIKKLPDSQKRFSVLDSHL